MAATPDAASSGQFVYGELTDAAEVIDILRAHSSNEHEVLLDFGSGDGGLVLGAAKCGVRSIGIELVRARHETAIRALDGIDKIVASRVEYRCEDAMAAVEPLARATMIILNNAVWDDELNARVAAAVGEHATSLCALGTTRRLPPAAAARASLALVHAGSVSVDWNPSGWPLLVTTVHLICVSLGFCRF